jgi:hypothetical protein
MQFAHEMLKEKFPLNVLIYDQLTDVEITYSDQLIFRFTKLQDTIGQKLFRLILEGLMEEVENVTFIDMLTRLEKLGILEDQQQWMIFRETRNQVTHEYPFNRDEIIDGLNELHKQAKILGGIWFSLKDYCLLRFNTNIL